MSKTVKACVSLFRIRVAESFQYRLSALSGAVTSLVWAVVQAALYTVFYTYADNAGFAGGLTLDQAISHAWLCELLLFMQPYSIDEDLLGKISSGDVGIEMCRPLDLYWHWFSRSSAGKIVLFVMRCLVCFLIGFFIPGGYGARPPVSFLALVMFIVSLLCAFFLCTAYGMVVTAVRMDVRWGNGPMQFLFTVAQVLSGAFLPLQLFPDVLQPFLLFQPFAGLCDIPARLYIGSMALSDAWFGMGVQLIWALLFVLLGRWTMSRRLRTIITQGG